MRRVLGFNTETTMWDNKKDSLKGRDSDLREHL